MGLLATLRLRRSSPFDPPTLLDQFLASPLQAFISALYSFFLALRGRPFHPPSSYPIRVVCLSDTHDLIPSKVPDGDLLIHAGDLTSPGSAANIQAQLDWLASLPHAHKVVVAGNHDSYFDPKSRTLADRTFKTKLSLKGLHYLEHDSVTLDFAGGRQLKIYGSPDIINCGGSDFAFQYSPDHPPWRGSVPADTDVLVTHMPPRYHLDLGTLGCPSLLSEVWRVRPKLHVVGHVHWGAGRRAMHFDACQEAFEALMSRPPSGPVWDLLPNGGWIDAVKVIIYGVHSVIFKWLMLGPGGNTSSSLLVNAALMKGNSGKLGNPVQVIDL
ncbi:metallophosphoesterase domain-containing protein [Plectosphaerella plurivora]|uniref:Metallophosphoesterase domain-containing protein n=1 Tax=Plectosphaerella plurivora TaxID=936078 RepID=A0A9P8VD29_9PEZI|nr:metallophosphoesterase domain-containing protein [Plectosphaerella plurivora]